MNIGTVMKCVRFYEAEISGLEKILPPVIIFSFNSKLRIFQSLSHLSYGRQQKLNIPHCYRGDIRTCVACAVDCTGLIIITKWNVRRFQS